MESARGTPVPPKPWRRRMDRGRASWIGCWRCLVVTDDRPATHDHDSRPTRPPRSLLNAKRAPHEMRRRSGDRSVSMRRGVALCV